MLLSMIMLAIFIAAILIMLGFVLMFLSSIVLEGREGKESKTEAGGVVIIGPIPLIFGTSTRIVFIILILAIVLMVLSIMIYILFASGVLFHGSA